MNEKEMQEVEQIQQFAKRVYDEAAKLKCKLSVNPKTRKFEWYRI